jgi:hypothetical protein
MTASRLLPLCMVFLLSLACAGSKNPTTDEGPAASAGEGGVSGPAEGDVVAEGEAGEGGGQACASDADCVPAECCHPTSCVVASAAPDCAAVSCSAECQPGTLDCGQGECHCENGACQAFIGQSL